MKTFIYLKELMLFNLLSYFYAPIFAKNQSFFGSLKSERVFFSYYKIREEAPRGIVDYIEMFYNCNRRHPYLGYVSPK